MPQISRFFGIIIFIFFDDHNPPHFHAKYGEFNAAVEISTLEIIEGYLPTRAINLVREWANLHINELNEDWELVKSNRTPKAIQPLE